MKHKILLLIKGCIIIMFVLLIAIQIPIKLITTRQELPVQKTLAISRGSIQRQNKSQLELFHETESTDEDKRNVGDDLVIMTFNIRHGANEQGENKLGDLIKEIQDSGANIIGLQEVDSFMPRSRFKNQAKQIADALGYYYVYGETINILGVKYGNAIISSFPIIKHENYKLASQTMEERGLLKAQIDVDGSLYHVYTTHLGLNTQERIQQIETISKTLEQDLYPIILLGDFNGEPDNKEMKGLTDLVVDVAIQVDKEDLFTYAFYSEKPNTRIDRIYLSSDILIQDYYVIDSQVSDHSMVLAIISRKPKGKGGIIAYI